MAAEDFELFSCLGDVGFIDGIGSDKKMLENNMQFCLYSAKKQIDSTHFNDPPSLLYLKKYRQILNLMLNLTFT